MPRKKHGNGWTHVKRSWNPTTRTPRPTQNPAAPQVPAAPQGPSGSQVLAATQVPVATQVPFARPSLRSLARQNREHILTYMLHQEMDITRSIVSNLTRVEALNFASASRQLRNLLAEQAGGRGPLNISNIVHWVDDNLDCQERVRGGLRNATFVLCRNQVGLQSCMGPLREPFFSGRTRRNDTDFHRPHMCIHCHDITDPACEAEERLELLVHQTGMCTVCEKRWMQRHPMGWRNCICRFREEQWFCWFCRTDKQTQWWGIRTNTLIRYEHAYRSHANGFTVDLQRRAEGLPRCYCGGKHTNHVQRNVAMCLICEGTIVRATAVTGNMRRRSDRLQQKYDDEDNLLIRGDSRQ
ncbi:hypothetical protein MMC26_003262 [Xylographa opegraphella]|nr:hypothetical protein [Xylographa opegraphella]